MNKKLQSLKNETIDRLTSETSDYFKPFQKLGAGLAVLGIGLKIAAIVFPVTMPIGLVSLAPEIISVGVTMFTGASLTKKK